MLLFRAELGSRDLSYRFVNVTEVAVVKGRQLFLLLFPSAESGSFNSYIPLRGGLAQDEKFHSTADPSGCLKSEDLKPHA